MKHKGYKSVPLSFTRQMVIASVKANKKNAIHFMTEIDVSKPRALRDEYFQTHGIKLSFTGYIVKCFAETIKEFPEMNSFISGKRLILLDDIRVSVLVEREIDGVKVPEPLAIKQVQNKSVRQIHDEIKAAQQNTKNELGSLTGSTWIKLIPTFLIGLFIKLAERNIKMAIRYGKVAVTAIGMNASSATWAIPHGTATVLLTIGSINKKNVIADDGQVIKKEYLCVTGSFDHEIVDGSPAARFMKRFEEILITGEFMK